MGILGRLEKPARAAATGVRCPLCGTENLTERHCKHVRWTFDQGDPLDFARCALEVSPYVRARGRKVSEISSYWWDEHGHWVVDHVVSMFHCLDGYVFGELGDLDILARDVWKRYDPDPVRLEQLRYDP